MGKDRGRDIWHDFDLWWEEKKQKAQTEMKEGDHLSGVSLGIYSTTTENQCNHHIEISPEKKSFLNLVQENNEDMWTTHDKWWADMKRKARSEIKKEKAKDRDIDL